MLETNLINQLAPLELKAKQIVEGFLTGIHQSPYYGYSVEFAEHRPYNQGDELRHIDWKVYGKSERFYVKQFEEETNLRCYIILDISPSMLFKYYASWSKLKFGVHLAASFIHLLHKQRDATGIITFDEEVQSFIQPKASPAHIRLLFNQLEQLLQEKKSHAERKTASANVLHSIADRIHKRSMVVLITDLFENTSQSTELIEALKHLRHKKHDMLVFNVLEKKVEREFDLPDKKFVLKDLETGKKLDVLPSQIQNEYKKRIEEHIHQFKNMCYEYHIDFNEVDTQNSFEKSMLAFLNKRRIATR